MSQPEAVRQAFARVEPLLADIRRYVRETLDPYSGDKGYIIVDRTKNIGSLSEKLESGRYASWSQLDDLYACTIVVPVSSHEQAVLDKLSESFLTTLVRSRSSARKAPDVFRFDGVRWYGRIRPDAADQRLPGVGKITFEVQVITAFEYAWKTVTHDLVYKSDDVEWKKQRLAAQLKAAVEQIEVIIGAFELASDAVLESPWPESEMMRAVISRFKALCEEGLISENLKPENWSAFASNFVSLVKSFRGDPARRPEVVSEILNYIETDLRSPGRASLPVSGTLFQYVLSVVARGDSPGDISRFVIVPSRELSDFHGLRTIPRPFIFDGVAATAVAVSDEGELPEQARDPEQAEE